MTALMKEDLLQQSYKHKQPKHIPTKKETP